MFLDSDITVLTVFRTTVIVLFPTMYMHDVLTFGNDLLARQNRLLAIVADALLNILFLHICLIVFHGERF